MFWVDWIKGVGFNNWAVMADWAKGCRVIRGLVLNGFWLLG